MLGKNGEYPHLHGWVFDLHTGLIKEVLNIDFSWSDWIQSSVITSRKKTLLVNVYLFFKVFIIEDYRQMGKS